MLRLSAVREELARYTHRAPPKNSAATRELRLASAPAGPTSARPLAWAPIVVEAFWMWLATRVVLVAFTLAAELIRLGGRADGYRQFSPRDILYTWKQWDAYWYTEIAHQGYWTWQSTAFFPLYPLMIRLTSFVVGQHWLLIAMGIASLAALGAFAGVGLLAANEQGGTRAATRAVRVFAAYPLAFFLTAPYTEGLFVALAAFTLLFARRWMWRWAALTAILAALTRPTAVVLFLPLVWELGRQRGWWRTLSGVFGSLRQQEWAGLAELRMRVRAWRARRWASALDWRAVADAVLPVVAIPAGFGIFMGYLWLRFGHPLLFLHAQRLYWQRFNVPPWDSIPMAINQLAGLPALSYYQARALVDYGPLVLFTLVTLLMIRRQPFSFTLYTAGLLYLAVASPMVATRDPDMFQSAGRFLLAAVPVFLLLGRWIRRRPALDLLLIGGGFLLQAALAAYYLSGGWLT